MLFTKLCLGEREPGLTELFQMYTKDHGWLHFQVIQGWIYLGKKGEEERKRERGKWLHFLSLPCRGGCPRQVTHCPLVEHTHSCTWRTYKMPITLAVWWEQLSLCWFMVFPLSSNLEFIRTGCSTYMADIAIYCIPHIIPKHMSLCEMLFYSFSIHAWMISCA